MLETIWTWFTSPHGIAPWAEANQGFISIVALIAALYFAMAEWNLLPPLQGKRQIRSVRSLDRYEERLFTAVTQSSDLGAKLDRLACAGFVKNDDQWRPQEPSPVLDLPMPLTNVAQDAALILAVGRTNGKRSMQVDPRPWRARLCEQPGAIAVWTADTA